MGRLQKLMRFLNCCRCCEDNDIEQPQPSLQELGYIFDEGDGKLTNFTTGYPFVFTDQRDYHILGKAVVQHIYGLLVSECKLTKKFLNDNQLSGGMGYFFTSAGIEDSRGKLLILIHGSGDVRAGQWSRRLIINHSLNAGSQLPYIQRANGLGWAVVVMNTNQQRDDHGREIQGSRTPEEHAMTVWQKAIRGCPATDIAIVAHSYGGVVTLALIKEFRHDFEQRVRAIAFTDSAHTQYQLSDRTGSYLSKVGRNWVRSTKPLDEPLPHSSYASDCDRVSAGTAKHEETSWKSIDAVFTFVSGKFLTARSP